MAIQFRKRKISSKAYEACSVFDVNGDGHLDIISGGYWYEGPDFIQKHKVCDIKPVKEYYADFSNYPMDVDGDGNIDVITGSFFDERLRWRRNPGVPGEEWQELEIDTCGKGQTLLNSNS